MSGWAKLTKQFTNDEIWFHVTAFRLYVWILLKAAYEDGMVLNGMELKKGQYVRAYSQLGEDLMYIEGRGKKILAKSTVKRAVDKLVKKGLLLAEETPFGTLLSREQLEREKQDKSELINVNIAKHRNGPVGVVKLLLEKRYSRFRDYQRVL